jgi:hypothetical protein
MDVVLQVGAQIRVWNKAEDAQFENKGNIHDKTIIPAACY